MRRRYIVEYDKWYYLPVFYSGNYRRIHRPWIVVEINDRVSVIKSFTNLWDAGAKMAKLNAREDQPA